ncbi:hypothetical protein [Pseudochrobactrum sp. AO18b]|uniref:hypothetical protein n=2 Tax=Pseudochrobactrum TaxID=354349 RepID=UPI0012EB5C47|nr:hypothetical protein [Pseudochrobactrum sp. AO18b]
MSHIRSAILQSRDCGGGFFQFFANLFARGDVQPALLDCGLALLIVSALIRRDGSYLTRLWYRLMTLSRGKAEPVQGERYLERFQLKLTFETALNFLFLRIVLRIEAGKEISPAN